MNNVTGLDVTALPKELTLLLAWLKAEQGQGPEADLQEVAGINWDLFLKLAIHHRVFPVLYRKLQAHNSIGIPSHAIQTLRNDYQRSTLQMLQLSAEMGNVCKLLSESGIRSLVLKGPVLAADLYGDISLRVSRDLDILIPMGDLDQVEGLLVKQGYEKIEYPDTVLNDWKWRHHHITFFHPISQTTLEIHWRLGPGPGKEPQFNQLWDSRRTCTLAAQPVYYLGREELFLFLVSHGARHGWSRLRWLADIDQIMRQPLDEERLFSLLKQYKLLHIGAQALILASNLLNTPTPLRLKRVTEMQRPLRLAQEAIFYVKQMINLHTNPVPEHVSIYHKRHLFSLMSPSQKMLFVLSFLYPYPEDTSMLTLPKSLYFLYFPLRPVLWMWRKSKRHALT